MLIAFGSPINSAQKKILLGDERVNEYLPLLEGKRVGVFSNQSGIVGDYSEGLLCPAGVGISDSAALVAFGTPKEGQAVKYGPHIVDFLTEKGIEICTIFSPEHGFRGDADAGEKVSGEIDSKTGIPIYSLYGKNPKPLSEALSGIDVLLIDIQDVGLRYYTYYITMLTLMEGCAELGKPVIILDRPNPNGFYIDGPILEEEFKSGVGGLPIATVHGLTLGELALMANGESWLKGGRKCELTVIECSGYTHAMKYRLLMRPSPNLKDMKAVYLYASTCYFEGTDISLGRGTDYPFEIYGAPQISGDYSFMPRSMEGAKNPPHLNELCHGVSLREKPLEEIWEEGINLDYLLDAYSKYPEKGKFFLGGGRFFNLLFGTDEVKKKIETGANAAEISKSWESDLQDYASLRIKYLLYPLQ